MSMVDTPLAELPTWQRWEAVVSDSSKESNVYSRGQDQTEFTRFTRQSHHLQQQQQQQQHQKQKEPQPQQPQHQQQQQQMYFLVLFLFLLFKLTTSTQRSNPILANKYSLP